MSSNDDPRLTLTFRQKGQIYSLCIYKRKSLNNRFLETVESVCIELNKYMEIHECQRSRSDILWPLFKITLIKTVLNFLL